MTFLFGLWLLANWIAVHYSLPRDSRFWRRNGRYLNSTVCHGKCTDAVSWERALISPKPRFMKKTLNWLTSARVITNPFLWSYIFIWPTNRSPLQHILSVYNFRGKNGTFHQPPLSPGADLPGGFSRSYLITFVFNSINYLILAAIGHVINFLFLLIKPFILR